MKHFLLMFSKSGDLNFHASGMLCAGHYHILLCKQKQFQGLGKDCRVAGYLMAGLVEDYGGLVKYDFS